MMALIWLGFFASIFLGWFYFLKARNKERMALIERDKDVSEIYAKREITFRFPWLKLGMLVTGIGMGLTITVALSFSPVIKDFIHGNGGMVPISLMLLFGGISMVVAHFIDRPRTK